MTSVGSKAERKEGPEKLCGRARYIDDVPLPGCLHAVTLRSSIARGGIKGIRFDPGFDWSETVTVTAVDIPGENVVELIEKDQPLLADSRVRHLHEPILVLGHPSRAMAYRALEHLEVDYEEEEPVLTLDEALRARRVVHPPDNVFKRFEIQKGSLRKGFSEAEVIVEEEYRLPHQEQAYIENNGVAAWLDAEGRLTILGSMQCPYYVHRAMQPLFSLEGRDVRIVQAATGGGFGGKEEYPNMIAGHAALLAIKAKRPVKLVYDRHEDMLATTKRHPARVRHRTGVRADGRLVAQEIDVVMDGGAYATLSSVVLSRGILHASGPYDCPNVTITGRTLATNTPPNGAFRGFGAPQTLFAAELQMERIARELSIDPETLRRRNLFREGSHTATGQRLRESVGATTVLDRVIRKSGYQKRRQENRRFNRRKNAASWRGVGLAVVFHGDGFTGSGEVFLKSRARVSLTREGVLRVDAASTEIGQGTSSMFAQIVADELRVPYSWIDVPMPDTSRVPDSGPTVASRTCMIVGQLLARSAATLRDAIAGEGGQWPLTRRGLRDVAKRLCAGEESFGFEVQYQKPEEIQWDETSYRGDAYSVFSYAAMVVELEVDRLTYEVKLRKVTTAQDVGKAINPTLVEGQILGGTVQGLGYALLEKVVMDRGEMANAELTNYIIPTTLDSPPIAVEIVEEPYSRGPAGAKGVGELPMDIPAPAVAAAIYDATGLFCPELPILPEHLARALR